MQQNINPENEIDFFESNAKIKNFKINKCKGKPFWLKLEGPRDKNYYKYKNQPQSYQAEQQNLTLLHKSKFTQQGEEEQQSEYAESVLSDNQNYTQDFQSYKESYGATKKTMFKLPHFRKINLPVKPTNASFNKANISLISSPQRKYNIQSFSNNKSTKALKTEPHDQSRYKTEQKTQQDYLLEVERQMLLDQNSDYLRFQNQKLIRKIQNMRKMIPIYLHNQRKLTDQNYELSELNQRFTRATSYEYEYEIVSNKSQLELDHKKLQLSLKKMNSPKYQKKQKNMIADKFIAPLNEQYKVREKLLHQMRLCCLRQQKILHLEKKLDIYGIYLQNLQSKQKIQLIGKDIKNLQRRKIFLTWDVEKMKNDFDLKVVEKNIELFELKSQIEDIDRQQTKTLSLIQEIKLEQNSEQSHATRPFKLKRSKQSQEKLPSKINSLAEKITQNDPCIVQNRSGRINGKIQFEKRPGLSVPKGFDSGLAIQIDSGLVLQKRQSQSNIYKPKKNIPEPLRSRKDKAYQQKLNVRIKKSAFKNAQINEELQQVFL